MAIVSRIILKDEYSGQAKKIISSTESLNKAFGKSQSESKKLDSSLSKAFGKKHKLTIKDIDSKKAIKNVNTIRDHLKKVTGKKNKIKIGLDGASKVQSGLSGIKSKLTSLKGALSGVLPMLGVAGLTAGAGKVLQAGSDLEQQQISMTHFLGGDQKQSDAYLAQLRNNANATPFETGEVVQAGTRAVQIAGGDTKKGMELVKLAEDMAALNPGKSISDAMEALADADMGEMERLKEFGYKGSKEEYDKAGGDLFKMKDVKGNTLQGMYEGGASKLAGSGAGVLSTIKGKLGSGLSDAGLKLVEALTPKLKGLIPVADKIATALPKAIDSAISGFGKVKDFLVPVFEKIKEVISPIIETISEGMVSLQPVLSDLADSALPFIQSALSVMGDVLQNILIPAFTVVVDVVKNILQHSFEILGNIIETVVIPAFNVAADFINTVLKPALEGVSVVLNEVVFPAFKSIAEFISDKVHGAFDKVVGIASKVVKKFEDIVGAVADAVSALKGIGGKISKVFTEAKDRVLSILPGRDKNANGTSYYGGGVTQINERGEELIDLPRGSRIYPQGKTDELIKKDIKSRSNSTSKVVYYQPRITINGSNMDKRELLGEIDKRFRRLAVNV